jgi:hypothetical protein
MIHHLKNFNTLVLYAAISCGVCWFEQLNPFFFYPMVLLRLCILVYTIYVIYNLEDNRVFATTLLGALLTGIIGGYWHLIELYIRFDVSKLLMIPVIFLSIPLIVFGFWLQLQNNAKTR